MSDPKSNRRASVPVTATLTVSGSALVLDVSDIVTKNERYRVVVVGPKDRKRATMIESKPAKAFKEAVAEAVRFNPWACVTTGLWRLDILSIWPTQRHHDDGTDTANGDADAPVSMVKDALQNAGAVDDDMRIVCGSEISVYEKGERRTIAILRPITVGEYNAEVSALVGLYNKARETT